MDWNAKWTREHEARQSEAWSRAQGAAGSNRAPMLRVRFVASGEEQDVLATYAAQLQGRGEAVILWR